MDISRIKSEFPAPSFRGNQRQALDEIQEAFENDNDIVLVQAPTGSGKSLLARAVAGCARRQPDGANELTDAYYTTPQVSQIDDVEADDLLSDFAVVRGKGNYDCIHPEYSEPSVPKAPCERISNFKCDHIGRCPYFVERTDALQARIAAMTLAYFFEHAPPRGQFEARDVVIVDEAHGLIDWAEMFGTISVGPSSLPDNFWDSIRPPELSSLGEAAEWAGHVKSKVATKRKELDGVHELKKGEAETLSQLQRLEQGLSWFLEEYHDTTAETRWLYDQPDGRGTAVTLRPVDPERVLYQTLWNRGENFLLLSATLLSKSAFCRSVGVSPSRVGFVELDHTFPLSHRPLYDVTQGKMTKEGRDETLPKIARLIDYLMGQHDDQKGIIHCHSYAIQQRLFERVAELGSGARIRKHSKHNRDRKLAEWKAASAPDVFFSVKMEEALDLKGELARWQVLCKAPYPHPHDPRVAARLENDRWGWYYRQALATVIQACGRVVRSPEDYGVTYLADSSLLDLFSRSRGQMPSWFRDQVDAMKEPTLGPLTPDRKV